MEGTNLIRYHHNLQRNLKLNGNYISNDGDDEGIRISDEGLIVSPKISDTLTIYNPSNHADYFKIDVDASGATTLSTIDEGVLYVATMTLDADGSIILKTALGGVYFSRSGTIFGNIQGGNQFKIQSVTDYKIELEAQGTGNILLNAGGNVGIGVADPDSALEVMSTGNILKLSYDADDYLLFEQQNSGGDSKLTSSGGMQILLAATKDFVIYENSNQRFGIVNSTSDTELRLIPDSNDTGDAFKITVTDAGATTIAATDDDGADAHLTIVADGHVEFDGCAVGFDQEEETFSGDDILASGSGTGGTHDTHIDFRICNKIYLQMTAAMDQMNLIFPAVSGNFLLHIWYSGDWAVGDWKVWESDLTAASNADVMWPGGTQPDNTASGKDVFSFYWDAETQICYGVASLAFAIPS